MYIVYSDVLGFIFHNDIKTSIFLLTFASSQDDNLPRIVWHGGKLCVSTIRFPTLQHVNSPLCQTNTFGNYSNNYHNWSTFLWFSVVSILLLNLILSHFSYYFSSNLIFVDVTSCFSLSSPIPSWNTIGRFFILFITNYFIFCIFILIFATHFI
jgi:hypothetical protein